MIINSQEVVILDGLCLAQSFLKVLNFEKPWSDNIFKLGSEVVKTTDNKRNDR